MAAVSAGKNRWLLGDRLYDSNRLCTLADSCGLRLLTQRMKPKEPIRPRPSLPGEGAGHRAARARPRQHPRGVRNHDQNREKVERYLGTLCCSGGGLGPLPGFVRGLHRVRLWTRSQAAYPLPSANLEGLSRGVKHANPCEGVNLSSRAWSAAAPAAQRHPRYAHDKSRTPKGVLRASLNHHNDRQSVQSRGLRGPCCRFSRLRSLRVGQRAGAGLGREVPLTMKYPAPAPMPWMIATALSSLPQLHARVVSQA